jgi:hypothetical protein
VIIRVVIVATCNIIFFHLLPSSIMDGEGERDEEHHHHDLDVGI